MRTSTELLTLSLLTTLSSAQSCDGGSVFSTSLCCLGTLVLPSGSSTSGPTNPVTSSPWDSPPIIPTDSPSASRPEPTRIPVPPEMTISRSPEELSSVLSSLASVAETEGGTMSILPIEATGASMPFFRPGQPDRSGMKRADKRNHGPYSVETPPADEPNAFGPPGLSHGGQGGVKTSPSTEQTGTVVIGEGTTCIGNVITMGTQSASVTGTGSGTAGASETITISSGTQGPSGISDSAGTSAPAATSATPGAGVMVESTRWDIVLGVAAVAGVVGLMI